MWQKILNIGADWNHQERIRESVITHSKNVATLSLFVKDHKPPGSFDPKMGPATRPVHNSKVGFDTALSNMISNFLEPIMDIRDDTNEVISTEDQQSQIDDHNEKVDAETDEEDTDTSKMDFPDDSRSKEYSGDTKDCDSKDSEPKRNLWPIFDINIKAASNQICKNCKCSAGRNFNDEGNVIVGGADVVGLYPACKASHSGLLAKQAVLESQMQFEGINYLEAARYCAMKLDRFEIRVNGLERVLPTRRFRKGTRPGVTGKGPLGKSSNDDELWVFPKAEPTELEKRRLIAACVEIGVKKAFTSHLYSFAGKVYLQQDGGPIGVRLAGAVARVVMGAWDFQLNTIMKENGMVTWLMSRYVDDVTAVVSALKVGVRWCQKDKQLMFNKEFEEEDLKENLPASTRTMAVVKEIMNSIYRNIKVTTEVPENFEDKKLPVLDFKCWMEEKMHNMKGLTEGKSRRILYTYYEKKMSAKYSILKTSALSEKTKVSSLSNDLVRRMKNVSELLDDETRTGVVNDYCRRLLRSGYGKDQVRQIVVAGLSGYQRIVGLAECGKTAIHRSAVSTARSRQVKKLTGKSTWFLDRKDQSEGTDQEPQEEAGRLHQGDHARKTGIKKANAAQNNTKVNTLTVLFVPQTPHGELAARLRQAEEELSKLVKYKVKVVEKSGAPIKSILVKTSPVPEQKCSRADCHLCKSSENSKCKARSVTYQTSCLRCKEKGKDRQYIGESARSGYERLSEHFQGYLQGSEDNHMNKHSQTDHGLDLTRPEFEAKILKTHQSALYRQVHEAVMIMKNEPITLNSRGEYNRCQLPRLTVMMGDKEQEEKEERDKEDEESEYLQEDHKRKGQPSKIIRTRKRRKLDYNQPASSMQKEKEVQSTPKRKRLQQREDEIVKKTRVQEMSPNVVSTTAHPDTRRIDTAISKNLQLARRTPSTHKQEKRNPTKGATNFISYFKKPTHQIHAISENENESSNFIPTLTQVKNTAIKKLSQSKPPKRPRPRKEQGEVKITKFFTKMKGKVEWAEKGLNSQSSDCSISS